MKTFLKRKKDKGALSVEGSLRGDSADEEDEFHDSADVRISPQSCEGEVPARVQDHFFKPSAFKTS